FSLSAPKSSAHPSWKQIRPIDVLRRNWPERKPSHGAFTPFFSTMAAEVSRPNLASLWQPITATVAASRQDDHDGMASQAPLRHHLVEHIVNRFRFVNAYRSKPLGFQTETLTAQMISSLPSRAERFQHRIESPTPPPPPSPTPRACAPRSASPSPRPAGRRRRAGTSPDG